MNIDFQNLDVFDELFCIRYPLGTHEFIIRGDSPHDDLNCGGSYDFVGCMPIGDFNQMRAIFKCDKCNVFFEDIYNYSGFETYEDAGMENAYQHD